MLMAQCKGCERIHLRPYFQGIAFVISHIKTAACQAQLQAWQRGLGLDADLEKSGGGFRGAALVAKDQRFKQERGRGAARSTAPGFAGNNGNTNPKNAETCCIPETRPFLRGPPRARLCYLSMLALAHRKRCLLQLWPISKQGRWCSQADN